MSATVTFHSGINYIHDLDHWLIKGYELVSQARARKMLPRVSTPYTLTAWIFEGHRFDVPVVKVFFYELFMGF
ncbi:hypothetical protein ES703_76398 [subsurface metagenome]